MSYTAVERETVCVCNDETDEWEIFCASGKMQTRMKKAGFEPFKTDSEGNAWYRVDYNQVSFRAKSRKNREWTPEQRRAAAERLAKARASKQEGK